MAESFMRTLKREEVDGRTYRDLAEARSLIRTFLEEIYNRQRLHSALAYLAPMVFETRLLPEPRLPLSGERGCGNRYDDSNRVCLISCLRGRGRFIHNFRHIRVHLGLFAFICVASCLLWRATHDCGGARHSAPQA